MSAFEKNEIYRLKPFSKEQVERMLQGLHSGRLVVFRRPPFECGECGHIIRTLHYIGDIDEVSEWKYTCDQCQQETFM